jgi:hypothetical protein
MLTWADVAAWLKQFAIIGLPSGAVAAYGVFKFVGTKWLDEKFTTRLEKLKHTQALELEQVRNEIQSTFSRITKIHEKEFEVVPKVWFMLNDAQGSAVIAVGGTLTFSPDFDHMPDEQLEEFLTTRSRLTLFQQREMRNASKPDRHKVYRKAIDGINFDEAKEKHRVLSNYLIENRIFLSQDIHETARIVADTIFTGLNSFDFGSQGGDYKLQHEGSR